MIAGFNIFDKTNIIAIVRAARGIYTCLMRVDA
jgi:hypothetical protein